MANLILQSSWTAQCRQIEPGDSVIGGAGAPINVCLTHLGNRTEWLKTEAARLERLIGTNLSTVNQGLSGKVDKTTQVTAGAGLTGGGALGGGIQIQLGTPGKLNGSTTNWAGSNTHTHEIDKATATLAGVVKLIDNLTAGGTDAALTAEQGKLLKQLIDTASAGAVPYTGATKHIDFNGKNLNNAKEVKLGNGRNTDYQQILMGNYERAPGNGNYGGVFNGTWSGLSGPNRRFTTMGTFGEDGEHISSLWADATKAYVRIGSTNHELVKAADTILAHGGTFTATVGYNRILSVNNGNDGMPDGAYKYGLGLSLASGNGKAQLYIAHTGGVYARGGYHTHPMQQWYRVDGADWSDVRGRPTTLAGYGITDAASRTDVIQAAPPGTVMYFAGRNPPAGWLKANGAAVSRTTYAPLFAAIGTIYGSGDGSTTFNLPDVRGEFVRGWDDGRGVDSGRAIGSTQGDQMSEHYHGVGWGDSGNDGYFRKGAWQQQGNERYYAVAGEGSFIVHDTTRQPSGQNNYEFASSGINGKTGETRPRNAALLAIIKI